MDYSEALKRIYRYLGQLDEMSKDRQNNAFVGIQTVKNIADGIRAYVDEIAESVDYGPED